MHHAVDEGKAAMREFFLQRLLPCPVCGFVNHMIPWIASR